MGAINYNDAQQAGAAYPTGTALTNTLQTGSGYSGMGGSGLPPLSQAAMQMQQGTFMQTPQQQPNQPNLFGMK